MQIFALIEKFIRFKLHLTAPNDCNMSIKKLKRGSCVHSKGLIYEESPPYADGNEQIIQSHSWLKR